MYVHVLNACIHIGMFISSYKLGIVRNFIEKGNASEPKICYKHFMLIVKLSIVFNICSRKGH